MIKISWYNQIVYVETCDKFTYSVYRKLNYIIPHHSNP